MLGPEDHYDVVIIGAGLAGLSLARQLSVKSNKKILLLEKRATVPPRKQKVSESLVKPGGYYFSKVVDMEEHLLRRHFMKYNLRFYWKCAGRDNDCFEDYNQGYLRTFSNIATYQLDRNAVEEELPRLNLENPNLTFRKSIKDLDIVISDDGPHTVRFNHEAYTVAARRSRRRGTGRCSDTPSSGWLRTNSSAKDSGSGSSRCTAKPASVRDIYQARRYHYFGAEPVYVGGGEEGMIICHLFDAEHVSSHFALLDAHRVAEGPVAKVRAPCPVHLGFHATFTAASP